MRHIAEWLLIYVIVPAIVSTITSLAVLMWLHPEAHLW